MAELKNYSKDGEITVFADAKLYSKEAIFKCLYWYGDKFHTNVSFHNQDTYKITLIPISTSQISTNEMELYLAKLERDLVDFSVRQLVNQETQAIRELLIAKAFANGEFDEIPVGELTDPVGFNVKDL
jgi:His-Xaa-Ser system protein HxsD